MQRNPAQVYYSSRPNSILVNTFILAGLAGAAFFLQRAAAEITNRFDYIGGSIVLLLASILLWIAGRNWIEVRLFDDFFEIRKQSVLGKTTHVIKFAEIKSVSISDYVGTIGVALQSGEVFKISSQIQKISGSLPEVWLDREPLPAERAKNIHMLRYEIQRRAKLVP